MAIPEFSMRELIEAGAHFGHKTKRWNPRMAPYIYGARNNIHIIDLQKTVPMLHKALTAVRGTVAKNGRILFVGTKRQASDIIAETATRCGQYYINQRWLGGMLTNWNTIQNSIRQLKKIEEQLGQENSGFTKKEQLNLQRQRDKLDRSLGGIRDMGGLPDMLFIIDVAREELAVQEAKRLGIPVVAIVDTNCSPEGIDFPIPGNDDASRAIRLYCQLISDAALDGIQQSLKHEEADAGESENPMEEAMLAAPAEAEEEKGAKGGKGARSTTKREAYAEAARKAAKKKETSDALEAAAGESSEAEEDKSAAKAPKRKAS